MMTARTRGITVAVAGIALFGLITPVAFAQRQMESLGRGLVAISRDDGKVFLGWRLLGADPVDVADGGQFRIVEHRQSALGV